MHQVLYTVRAVQVERDLVVFLLEKTSVKIHLLAAIEQSHLILQCSFQQEREAQIAREAAEKATREAERVQREKAESEQREARLKAEKEAAELHAVQAAENERKRIEAEQFAQAEAARKAEEARLANVEHRK